MLNLDRLWERAKEKRYTISALADAIGKQRYFFYDVKNKGLKVNRETVEKLATVLETTPAYLEGETDNPDIVRDTDEFVDIYRLVNNRPSTKLLFSALKGASDEDIKRTIEILNALKRTNGEL